MAFLRFEEIPKFRSGKRTKISRPKEIAYFSFDEQHRLKPFSTESLRYYYPPVFGAPGSQENPIDLSAGFDAFSKRDDDGDQHLDALLDTLRIYEEQRLERAKMGELSMQDVKAIADIITWRGIMTKAIHRNFSSESVDITDSLQILTAPYDALSDFELSATCYEGTIYIEEIQSYKKAQEGPTEKRQELMQYWGYKFETISVLPKPWAESTREEIEARNAKVVNENAQYCSIVQTRIGDTTLILAGEVDAVAGEKPENVENGIPWVELKTTQEPSNDRRDRMKFERKLLRYWAQSFLLGVPRIVLGYRNQSDGMLMEIAEIETLKIPKMVQSNLAAWDGNVCIDFASTFFDMLKNVIVVDSSNDGGDGAVWLIKKERNGPGITVSKAARGQTRDVVKVEFMQHRERLKAWEVAAALGRPSVAVAT